MNIPFCPGYTQYKPYEGFKTYIAGEMSQNLKQFVKECMITEQWKRVMLHNQTHTTVYSSAMYTTKIWLSFMNVVKN